MIKGCSGPAANQWFGIGPAFRHSSEPAVAPKLKGTGFQLSLE